MNRYVLDGLLADARAGKRVMFVGDSLDHAHVAFDSMSANVRRSDRVRSTRGRELITTSEGGSVAFASAATVATAVRGQALDVVFVDTDLDLSIVGRVLPAVQSGELLRR